MAIITYKIEDDRGGRLKAATRTACNFWNSYLSPSHPIVIRVGTFWDDRNIIARAWEPYFNGPLQYGRVQFNRKFLRQYTDPEIAGTMAHELGHTLGFGWNTWATLFEKADGSFSEAAIEELPALKDMLVETDFGPGTRHSHWDEERFGAELMTGIKDHFEHVLPVTIDVMGLLGHTVTQSLSEPRKLDDLLREAEGLLFSRRSEAKALDLDYFEVTTIEEEIAVSDDRSR